jgi:hypothetical protein
MSIYKEGERAARGAKSALRGAQRARCEERSEHADRETARERARCEERSEHADREAARERTRYEGRRERAARGAESVLRGAQRACCEERSKRAAREQQVRENVRACRVGL